jgi:hypothetical protein
MTTYPISKIRSGEVAVLLTDIMQFKKIAPEQTKKGHFKSGSYHLFSKFHKAFTWVTSDYIETSDEITCDFTQIDWEEGKEETVEDVAKKYYEDNKFKSDYPHCSFSFIDGAKWQKEQSDKELTSLKAENERLSKRVSQLEIEAEVTANKYSESLTDIAQLKLQLRDSSKTSQNQELSLRQRMAWEYLKENPQVGVEKSFKYIDNFLNYKGGENE